MLPALWESLCWKIFEAMLESEGNIFNTLQYSFASPSLPAPVETAPPCTLPPQLRGTVSRGYDHMPVSRGYTRAQYPLLMAPQLRGACHFGGVFAQRGHSANYYGDYPGNNPENHPPAESCTINSKLKNSNI